MNEKRQERDMAFSRAQTCMIMLPSQANANGNVHGGELMKVMDSTAGIAAMKHAGGNVVTARVDELMFHHAIHIGDIVTVTAQVAYVGKSSMQVIVTVQAHKIASYQDHITALTAFFTMVHLGEDGKPARVPVLLAGNEEAQALYASGEAKYLALKR